MEYGAKCLRWAPFAATNPEPENALPNYGTPMTLGELVKVSDNPSFVEGKAAGDNNATARYIKKFQQCTVDAEVLEFSNEVAAAIFGSTLDTTENKKNLHFNDADNPPYGGLAFYTTNLMSGNVVKFQGVYYPKLKASMQGKEYSTTGDSITLTSGKTQFLAMRCNNGDWKVQSEFFSTEAEAIAWVNEMVKAASST